MKAILKILLIKGGRNHTGIIAEEKGSQSCEDAAKGDKIVSHEAKRTGK